MSIFREIAAVLGNLFRWWFVVAPWEQAIRVRLGKHTKLLGAGVHFRIPYLDKVYVHTTRKRLVHTSAQTLTTKDGKHVTIAGSLGYSIADLLKMYDTLHQPKDTIVQELMGEISSFIVTHDLDACAPSVIEQQVNDRRGGLLAAYGIKSHGFIVTDFAVVRTYRLLNGDIDRYEQAGLSMGGDSND